MKRAGSFRVSLMALAVMIALAALTTSLKLNAAAERSVASVIRITPAAPVFEDKERLAELAQRRNRVAQAIGPKSLLVMFFLKRNKIYNAYDKQLYTK